MGDAVLLGDFFRSLGAAPGEGNNLNACYVFDRVQVLLAECTLTGNTNLHSLNPRPSVVWIQGVSPAKLLLMY